MKQSSKAERKCAEKSAENADAVKIDVAAQTPSGEEPVSENNDFQEPQTSFVTEKEQLHAQSKPIKADVKEDPLGTIKEIKRLAQEKKTHKLLVVLSIIFFPITLILKCFQFFAKKIKLSVTTKTTVIFTVLFGLLIIGYVIFIITSIDKQLSTGGVTDKAAYMRTLKISSVVLVLVFIAIGAALGNLASQYMMTPLRKIIKEIDKVNSENLSTRIGQVDSQDELRELTIQINEMLDELENTFDRQSNFISDASHELKTPISVVQGYANMLKRWGKTDPALLNESIDTILKEADNMKRIVEQLLLLAKIGNFTMAKTEFDMTEAVRELVGNYGVTGLKHEMKFVSDGRIIVCTDKNMLIESVRTLIDNALKYTPEGGKVTVSAKNAPFGAVVKVSDNGMGISEENLPHIFERFFRCDKVRGRETGSSGLGLTIAKSIIEMIGGVIEVESKLGVGTTFTVKLF